MIEKYKNLKRKAEKNNQRTKKTKDENKKEKTRT